MIEVVIEQLGLGGGVVSPLSSNCFRYVKPDTSVVRLKIADSPESQHFLKREALWLQRLSRLQANEWNYQCLALHSVEHVMVLESDFIEGLSLRELLQAEQRAYPSQVNSIIEALNQTLNSLHQQGIVHCDIKPANVIFSPFSKRLTLIDFANARRFGKPLIERGFHQLTPSYRADSREQYATYSLDYHAAAYCIILMLFNVCELATPMQLKSPFEVLRHFHDQSQFHHLPPTIRADLQCSIANFLHLKDLASS